MKDFQVSLEGLGVRVIEEAIVEEIDATDVFRFYDRRRGLETGTLFFVIPIGKKYGATRQLEQIEITRIWRTQDEAIREISRNFYEHPLGIEIDFEIIRGI